MGHEYIHVAHMVTLGDKFYGPYSEYAAYRWNSRVSGSSYFDEQSLRYFNPATIQNQGILKNVINPKYMQLGNFGIFDYIPKGVLY